MGDSRASILVVEDEPDIIEVLQYNLEKERFQIRTATDGQKGVQMAIEWRPDLILLDLMLPVLDGLSVCKRLRQNELCQKIPIIMLTAKGVESDKVVGLEVGADDYITKPFSIKELIARIRAVLRRPMSLSQEMGVDTVVSAGPITINLARHRVMVRDAQVKLTIAEFRLLKALASVPGRVFTREQLLTKITGGEGFVIDRNVDVHVGALRKKLGGDSRFIETVRGVGYRFSDEMF